jgi:RNA polymerase sigma factor (sigma-70 family)
MSTGRLTPVLRCFQQVTRQAEAAGLSDGQLLERFVRTADEAAFTVLVRRHGPMVLGVCRRVLRDPYAADDAFQATFLLLVRKARSLRRPDLLGPWLYGVAQRTALKSRTLALRRRLRERPVQDVPAAAVADEVNGRDLRPLLDEAIGALPAKYRTPFVLCHLEGLTYAQAAARLRCPPGTLATWVARARERLRTRLARQGLTASAGLLAAVAVPPSLLAATVRMASASLTGRACAGVVSASVVALMKGVGKAMLMEKLKVALLAVTAAGVLGAGVLVYRASGGEPAAGDDEAASRPLDPHRTQWRDEAGAPDAVCRTPNFTVHAPTDRIARLVAEAAERFRKDQALLWLERELPAWPIPCDITIRITSAGSGGATSFSFDRGRVSGQRMNLEGSLEQILANSLPHEITHTVWAHAFGKPVPRWADEGAAVLAEDEPERWRHDRLVRQIVDDGRAIPLRRLFALADYPKDVLALFAEGYSVTDFLVCRADHPTFVAFVKQGSRDGWDQAVQTHYRLRDVDQLEQVWTASLLSEARRPPARDKRHDPRLVAQAPAPLPPAELPTPVIPPAVAAPPADEPAKERIGPAPHVALARVAADGSLLLRQPAQYYQPVTKYARVEGEEGVTPITRYVLVNHLQTQRYNLGGVQGFRVSERYRAGSVGVRVNSRRLDTRELRDLLKEETTVLVSADGQAVHPFYLKVVKDETIVLQLPPPAPPPPAPALPPPAQPPVQVGN